MNINPVITRNRNPVIRRIALSFVPMFILFPCRRAAPVLERFDSRLLWPIAIELVSAAEVSAGFQSCINCRRIVSNVSGRAGVTFEAGLAVAGPLIMVTRPQRECRKSPNLSHSPQGVAGVFFAPGEGLLLVFEIQRKRN